MLRDIFAMLLKLKVSKPEPDVKISPRAHAQLTLMLQLATANPPPAPKNTPFRANWTVTGTHLISNLPTLEKTDVSPVKVAAFDLDGTLVKTVSGSKFARGAADWQWFNDKVRPKLAQLQQDNYMVVVFTNQGGVLAHGTPKSKSYVNFTGRVNLVQEKADLKRNMAVFASSKRPAGKNANHKESSSLEDHASMRKPGTGMWEALDKWVQQAGLAIDKSSSFYVGDAAGRQQDFLDSDREFARSVEVKFWTPEEYFV